jgi:hypothetical protein
MLLVVDEWHMECRWFSLSGMRNVAGSRWVTYEHSLHHSPTASNISYVTHRQPATFHTSLTENRGHSIRKSWTATLEMVYQDSCPKYNWVQPTVISSILLCPTHYCVQQFTVSSKILCPHLFLIYTCLTFPCWHAAVVSCFALCSSFVQL